MKKLILYVAFCTIAMSCETSYVDIPADDEALMRSLNTTSLSLTYKNPLLEMAATGKEVMGEVKNYE